MTIRTRFAPSPTGYLHIGGARTALYSWLFAKQQNGKFVLRIEDTDPERSTDESMKAILDSMDWLGLDYDEGPFYQSKRFDRYDEVAQQLIESGHAYRCYCSKERLQKIREDQLANKEKPKYDGYCRDIGNKVGEQAHVIRFKTPIDGEVVMEDMIHGQVVFQNNELDDLILIRTDGVPTYNFTVVVDDLDMKISHVIRGDDHINNTPRQLNILKAMGAEPPIYAHVPMILGDDGKRLSKRHGAVSVLQYRDEGYLPEVLLNYLIRLGWSHGDQEIFTVEEMIKLFNINDVHKSAAAFNPEKLNWLNQQYLMHSDPSHLADKLAWNFGRQNIDITDGPDLINIINAQKERVKTLKEMAERSRYFYEDIGEIEEGLLGKHFKPEVLPALTLVANQLNELGDWSKEPIHDVIVKAAEAFDLKLGKIAQPIRVAVTGGTMSPPIDLTLKLMGKEKVLKRLESAISQSER